MFLNNSIVKILSEKEILVFEDEWSILPENKFIQLIVNHNICDEKSYKLSETLLYNIDLESNHIQNYNNDNKPINFLNPLSRFDVIKVSPSLFVFHSLNCIFMIFKEIKKKIKEKVYKTQRIVFRKDAARRTHRKKHIDC